MGSEPCVLDISSSDEDDDEEDDILFITASTIPLSPLPQKKRKVPVHPSGDNDVVVIEKLPCPEGRIMDKRTVIQGALSVSETKKFPGKTGDDDCCILDYDPDKSLPAPDSPSNDAADLVMTRESGPVACRDYPHARHLCAKFPFKSTSHQRFCEQCHCYVCDTLAPCLLWGEGKQSSDHCHAFDKDENWKALRQLSKSPSLPAAASSSQPLPSRAHVRPRIHPRSSSQPPAGMAIISSGFSPSMSLSHPVLAPGSVWTSDSRSPLTGYLRPYVPSATNVTRASGAHSARMLSPASVPVTGVSSQARMATTNQAVTTSSATIQRPRIFGQYINQVTNWGGITAVASGAERRGLNQSGQRLPNVVDTSQYSSTMSLQGCTRRGAVQKNATVQTSLQGIDQEQTYAVSSVHATVAEPFSTTSRNPIDRMGGQNHGGLSQSCPISFSHFTGSQLMTLRDYLYNGLSEQREREQQTLAGLFQSNISENGCIERVNTVHNFTSASEGLARACTHLQQGLNADISSHSSEEIVGVGSGLLEMEKLQQRWRRQWDHLNVSQTSEYSALAANFASTLSQDNALPPENVYYGSGFTELEIGPEANRSAGAGQNVQVNSVIDMTVAPPVAFQDPHRENTEQQLPVGHETDASPSLDDILAQLEANDMWESIDFDAYQ